MPKFDRDEENPRDRDYGPQMAHGHSLPPLPVVKRLTGNLRFATERIPRYSETGRILTTQAGSRHLGSWNQTRAGDWTARAEVTLVRAFGKGLI